MAEGEDKSLTKGRLRFTNIQLMKDQTLGIGSYGKVCKAQCDELVCAAKLMHETLFDPVALGRYQDKEHRLPIKRFELECEFLSAVRHPNIIQYLGVYHDPSTHLPALLMELMDDNLTNYLMSSIQPLAYRVQLNICHDISLALSFLHSNGIIHRDLSSNNVLMFGNSRAKVTDFGMARLDGLNPRATRPSYTTCPGSDVYMPPETIKAKPTYNEKVDCFAFGVIVVQIVTRKFPEPGDREKELDIDHPGIQAGAIQVRVSEVERRKNHINLIDQNHQLLPIALDCLKDKQNERPSAPELSKRLSTLKEECSKCNPNDNYHNSKAINTDDLEKMVKHLQEQLQLQAQQKDHTIEASQQEIQHLREQLQQAEQLVQEEEQQKHQIICNKDEEIRQLRQKLEHVEEQLRERNQHREEKDQTRQERKQTQQLETNEQVQLHVVDLERRIYELEQQLRQTKFRSPKVSNTTKSNFQLSWSNGENAPRKMYRECNAITDGATAYFQVNSDEIHVYNTASSRWSQLPNCRYQGSALAVINNSLTAIGGEDIYVIGYCSVFTLENARQWKEILPPMEIGRTHSIAICTGTALIVAGGWNGTSVEVMNTETQTWSNAAPLPEPIYNASATICRDRIYVLGGHGATFEGVTSVFTCSLSTLLQSCSMDFPDGVTVWSKITDLPVTNSTCVSLNGRLLAIGGIEVQEKPACTAAVYMYSSIANSWEIVSHMQEARSHCYAAVLPNNQLMVVGGQCDPKGTKTNTVEFATTSINP